MAAGRNNLNLCVRTVACAVARAFALGWILAVAASCTKGSKLGFSVGDTQGAASFGGITAIQLSSEGKHILVWNPATNSGDFASTTYEIFMDPWDPSKPLPPGAGLSTEKS